MSVRVPTVFQDILNTELDTAVKYTQNFHTDVHGKVPTYGNKNYMAHSKAHGVHSTHYTVYTIWRSVIRSLSN